jgi:hypothetical protein
MSKASEYAKAVKAWEVATPKAPREDDFLGQNVDVFLAARRVGSTAYWAHQQGRPERPSFEAGGLEASVDDYGYLSLPNSWGDGHELAAEHIPALIAWLTDTFTEPQNLAHSPRCSVNVVPGTGCTCNLNKTFTDGGT